MPVLTCPHCQQLMSTRLDRCPHCGREAEKREAAERIEAAPAVSPPVAEQPVAEQPRIPEPARPVESASVREYAYGGGAGGGGGTRADSDMRMMRVQMQQKNLGIACLLTLFFGGLGMLYTSIIWGSIAVILELVVVIVALVAAALTFGLGFVLVVPFHVICVFATIFLVNRHNRLLLEKEFRP